MPLLTDASKNAGLDAIAALATHIGLHSAYPDATGSNEIAGGSPAYARQAIAWASAASGAVAITGTETFDVEGGDTAAFGGLWSAGSGGTFRGKFPLQGALSAADAAPRPFYAAAGTDVISSDAHGFVDGNQVIVVDAGGGLVVRIVPETFTGQGTYLLSTHEIILVG